MTETPRRPYPLPEEIANGITHGIGAVLSLIGLIWLVVMAAQRGDARQIVSFSIYGGSMVALYLASTLYHSIQRPRIKRVFRTLDHAMIYLLIAGTYTPFLVLSLRGPLGWTLLALVWGIALAGIGAKTLFTRYFRKPTPWLYILMGWLGVIGIGKALTAIPLRSLLLIATGGVIYTLGVLFYAWRKLPYNHAIWHLFVLGGSTCHYLAVLSYLS